jgi:hypothetical protein
VGVRSLSPDLPCDPGVERSPELLHPRAHRFRTARTHCLPRMNAFPTSTAWPQLQRCPTCLAVVPLWETLAHAQRHQTLAYSPSLASLSPHSRTFGLAPLDGFLQGSAPGFDSLFAEAALPSVPMRQPDWACDYPAASPYVVSPRSSSYCHRMRRRALAGEPPGVRTTCDARWNWRLL